MARNRTPSSENPPRRIALLTDWDGTNYAGWQSQKGVRTLQDTLQQALSRILGEPIILTGCSRTDAGVHARGHVSHFDTRGRIPVEKLPLALNALLPADIGALAAAEVPATFHARYQPVAKQYSYYVARGACRSGLLQRYTYSESRSLDLDAMRQAAKLFEGTHDFRCCMATGGQVRTTVRTVHLLHIQEEAGCLRFVVRGNGFLYNMVRILAGTLLYVGLGKLEEQMIVRALETGDRTVLGKTLPARGLFLDRVEYEPDPFGFRQDGLSRESHPLGLCTSVTQRK